MSVPLHTAVYAQVVADAKSRMRYPSLGATVWIRKEYAKRGGTFDDDQHTRWCEERWVHVIPFLKRGRVVDCGAYESTRKACRPIHRVDEHTPVTLPELLGLYTKTDILEMARKKNKNAKRDVNWDELKFNHI